MKKLVVIDFDIEGFHYYPKAPKEVSFLSAEHRHLFQVKAGWLIKNSNRELEIFIQTDKVMNWLRSKYGNPCKFESMSCEMIAEDILKNFNCYFVEVLEDGQGGARVEHE
jgi:hypothetical protein|tara:strand:- start:50 stop:379 length:330 start_codon:yes stop_codon:yes gene_type:complete